MGGGGWSRIKENPLKGLTLQERKGESQHAGAFKKLAASRYP
jgi:hypothetical protein